MQNTKVLDYQYEYICYNVKQIDKNKKIFKKINKMVKKFINK